MWQTLMNWLPDLKQGTFEVRDLLNLLMTVLGAYLAWLAIRMGRRQNRIVEQQHAIWTAEQAKKTDLRVLSGAQNIQFSSHHLGHSRTHIQLYVRNGGTKTADGFHWEVFIPRNLVGVVQFLDDEGNQFQGQFAPFSEEVTFDKLYGIYNHKLYTESDVNIIRISVNSAAVRAAEFGIRWRLRTEDGLVPKQGLAQIRYERQPDGMFAVMHPWPPDGSISDGPSEEP